MATSSPVCLFFPRLTTEKPEEAGQEWVAPAELCLVKLGWGDAPPTPRILPISKRSRNSCTVAAWHICAVRRCTTKLTQPCQQVPDLAAAGPQQARTPLPSVLLDQSELGDLPGNHALETNAETGSQHLNTISCCISTFSEDLGVDLRHHNGQGLLHKCRAMPGVEAR